MRPGLVQEARADFIEGCQGRTGEQPDASMQGLKAMASLLGQNGQTTETESEATTA